MAKWFRFRIGAWMAGTDDLTLEQEAAYLRIVAAINLYDEPVRNNLMVLGGLWRCNHRKAKRLRDELEAAGKIVVNGTVISNPKALEDIEERANSRGPGSNIKGLEGKNGSSISRQLAVDKQFTSNSRQVNKQNSPPKSLESKDTGSGSVSTEKKEKRDIKVDKDLEEAYQIWNDIAKRYPSLPSARNVDGPTRDGLKIRLREQGLDGWRLAMKGIERSPWHRNEDEWKNMNLSWAVNRTNFEKLQMLGEGPALAPTNPGGGKASPSFWDSYKARHGKD